MKPGEEGTWVLLSKALGDVPDERRPAELRALMEQIADGRVRIRYLDSGDPLTEPRDYRYDPLPDLFFRLGRVNWIFSEVTFGGRTVHQIELFVHRTANAVSGAESMTTLLRKRGRPRSRERVIAEAGRRRASGERFPTKAAEARELSAWLKRIHPDKPQMKPESIENVLAGVETTKSIK